MKFDANEVQVGTRKADQRRLGLALLLLAGCVLAVYFASMERFDDRLGIWLGSSAVFLAGLVTSRISMPGLELSSRRNIALGTIFPIYFGVGFGLTTLTSLGAEGPRLQLLELGDLRRALWSALIAILAWWLGYRSTRGVGHNAAGRRIQAFFGGARGYVLRFPTAPLALYSVGFGARLVLIFRGQFSYLGDVESQLSSPSLIDQMLNLFSSLTQVGLILLAIDFFYEGKSIRRRAALISVAALEAIFASFGGGKESFLLVGLSVVLAGILARKIRLRNAVLLAVVAIVLIFPFNSNYRTLLRPAPGQQASTGDALSLFAEALDQSISDLASPTTAGRSAFESLSGRLGTIESLAVIAKRSPEEISYRPPGELITRPLSLAIPRVMWPAKPADDSGLRFTQEYLGQRGIISASAITLPGGFYMHGGLIPTAIGMMLVGALMRFLDEVFDLRQSPIFLVPFSIMLTTLVKGENDFGSTVVGLVRAAVILIPAIMIVMRRPKGEPSKRGESDKKLGELTPNHAVEPIHGRTSS